MKPKKSRQYVSVSCPDCGHRRPMRSDQYARTVKADRPFYCLPCSQNHKVYQDTARKVFDFDKLDWSNNKRNPWNPLYSRWQKIHRRCAPDSYHATWYYNTGIYVDSVWAEYEPFRKWALKHGFKPELELDRIDPYGPYSPKNCRWVTHAVNCNNKRPRGFAASLKKRAA